MHDGDWMVDAVRIDKPGGTRGYLLVIGDASSGEIIVIKEMEALSPRNTAEALQAALLLRRPLSCSVDAGEELLSQEVGEIAANHGIDLRLQSSASPSGRGAMERMVLKTSTGQRNCR